MEEIWKEWCIAELSADRKLPSRIGTRRAELWNTRLTLLKAIIQNAGAIIEIFRRFDTVHTVVWKVISELDIETHSARRRMAGNFAVPLILSYTKQTSYK